MWTIAFFSDVFEGSAYANDDLRPKVWYENDRKNMENLLKHKLEKMLIFDQKILEVANGRYKLIFPISITLKMCL